MGWNDHIGDRKLVYVDELEKILNEIEYWERIYEMSDIPGNRDPQDKKDATEKIGMYTKKFEEKKKQLQEDGKPIYR